MLLCSTAKQIFYAWGLSDILSVAFKYLYLSIQLSMYILDMLQPSLYTSTFVTVEWFYLNQFCIYLHNSSVNVF